MGLDLENLQLRIKSNKQNKGRKQKGNVWAYSGPVFPLWSTYSRIWTECCFCKKLVQATCTQLGNVPFSPELSPSVPAKTLTFIYSQQYKCVLNTLALCQFLQCKTISNKPSTAPLCLSLQRDWIAQSFLAGTGPVLSQGIYVFSASGYM